MLQKSLFVILNNNKACNFVAKETGLKSNNSITKNI